MRQVRLGYAASDRQRNWRRQRLMMQLIETATGFVLVPDARRPHDSGVLRDLVVHLRSLSFPFMIGGDGAHVILTIGPMSRLRIDELGEWWKRRRADGASV